MSLSQLFISSVGNGPVVNSLLKASCDRGSASPNLLAKVMERGSDVVVSGGEMPLLMGLLLPTWSCVAPLTDPLRMVLCFAVVSVSAFIATFCFPDTLAVGFAFPRGLFLVFITGLGCPLAGSILPWSRRCTFGGCCFGFGIVRSSSNVADDFGCPEVCFGWTGVGGGIVGVPGAFSFVGL